MYRNIQKLGLAVSLGALLSIGSLLIGAVRPAAAMTVPGQNGKIVFQSDRDGDLEIYVMNADGTGTTQLTFNTAGDSVPAWSPDGEKIAFASARDGGQNEIYVMNADGSGQTRLTNNGTIDATPEWSPDGEKIAFSSNRDGNNEIYVMNADGSNQTRLTNDAGSDSFPEYSPDGSKIAFYTNRDGNNEVYVMNADGSNVVRLTTDPATDGDPSWSPDGSKIVFVSTRDGSGEIYVMNADGSGQTRLTNNAFLDQTPIYSPDGAKIAFYTDRDGQNEIYVMNADGTNPMRLTNDAGFDSSPSWQSINIAPVAENDTATTTMNTAVTMNVLANDSDTNNELDTGSLRITTSPAHGTTNVQAGKVVYIPADGYTGTDTFGYEICDTSLATECASATGTIQVMAPPAGNSDAAPGAPNTGVGFSDTKAKGITLIVLGLSIATVAYALKGGWWQRRLWK